MRRIGVARTCQVLRLGSNASDAVPFGHRILSRASHDSVIMRPNYKPHRRVAFWRVRRSGLLGRLLGRYLLFGQLQQ